MRRTHRFLKKKERAHEGGIARKKEKGHMTQKRASAGGKRGKSCAFAGGYRLDRPGPWAKGRTLSHNGEKNPSDAKATVTWGNQIGLHEKGGKSAKNDRAGALSLRKGGTRGCPETTIPPAKGGAPKEKKRKKKSWSLTKDCRRDFSVPCSPQKCPSEKKRDLKKSLFAGRSRHDLGRPKEKRKFEKGKEPRPLGK